MHTILDMYFDRNNSENRAGKKNEGSYLSCVTNGELYFIQKITLLRYLCQCLQFHKQQLSQKFAKWNIIDSRINDPV